MLTVGIGMLRLKGSGARSSVVERPAHNRLVVGSNPAGPIISNGKLSSKTVRAEFTVAGMVSKHPNRPHNVISLYRQEVSWHET